MKVLVCDDEENIRKLLKRLLNLEGIDADCAENGLSAQRMIASERYDAIVADLRMPGLDGLGLLRWIRAEGFRVPVMMISAHGDINDAVTALKEGADDYLVKPFDPDELLIKLKGLVKAQNLMNAAEGEKKSSGFLGASSSVEQIRRIIERIAPSSATVLITGESGTGKEVAARQIHALSSVSSGPFMAINIGGVPENLIESELFGYEKGAFTGAEGRKPGLFELASGGTLFLDEIGDMPAALQVKILRVLQEKKITRLGGTSEIPINARIVAATNRNLEDMVREGTFREDLFYRLNVVRIRIPPLRERPDDIPVLAQAILAKYAESMGMRIKGFSPEALDALSQHPFYGNVRELENVIERAMIFADSDVIEARDLDLRQALGRGDGKDTIPIQDAQSLKDIERNAIIRSLHRWEGNRTRSAEELGISRRTLITKIQEYGIDL